MDRRFGRSGFTLIELMIVVAIIAIVAAMAIPQLSASKATTNEAAAVATLRSIASAQAQVQASGAIDTDADGAGEYAYLAELAGTMPMRVFVPGVGAAAGAPGIDVLDPSLVSGPFGAIVTDANGHGVVTRNGYVYKLWLPDNVGGTAQGVGEDPAGPPGASGGKAGGPFPDANYSEYLWCCYAWPIQANLTGTRVFFTNQEGDILQMNNRIGVPYDGITAGVQPAYDAAYSVAGDMSSPAAVDGNPAADGNIWTVVHQ